MFFSDKSIDFIFFSFVVTPYISWFNKIDAEIFKFLLFWSLSKAPILSTSLTLNYPWNPGKIIGLHLHPVWFKISISIKDRLEPSLIYIIYVATSLHIIPFLLFIIVFEIEFVKGFLIIGFSADCCSFFYFFFYIFSFAL